MASTHAKFFKSGKQGFLIAAVVATSIGLAGAGIYTISGLGTKDIGDDSLNGSGGEMDYRQYEWYIEVLDNETMPDSMSRTSIAVDSHGHSHIAYYGDYSKLWYITDESGAWARRAIDFSGYYPSIAVDLADQIHISYFSTGYSCDTHRHEHDPSLKYASSSNGWVPTIVESHPDCSFIPSIAVDSDGCVHIAYYRKDAYASYSGSLRYATNALGSWTTETVDPSEEAGQYFGQSPSIAMDSRERVHVVYQNTINPTPGVIYPRPNCSGFLRHATLDSGTWTMETIEEKGSVYINEISVGIDSRDRLHIAFVTSPYDSWTESFLKYAYKDSESWTIEIVNTTLSVRSCSIAIDSSDIAHVLCLMRSAQDFQTSLWYLTLSGNGYSASQVDDSDLYSVGGAALVLDADDLPHASYYYNVDGHTGLKHASGTPS